MEYTVQEETMQAIADAIRERSETSDPILTSDMPSLILTLKAKWGEITGDIEDQVDLNELFAKVNGYYEDMSVGSAEQLLSNMFEDDSDPYLFRSTAGSKEIGDRVYEDAIVGASVAWNQLVPTGGSSQTNRGVTTTFSADGTWTFNGLAESTGAFCSVGVRSIKNHVWFMLGNSDDASKILFSSQSYGRDEGNGNIIKVTSENATWYFTGVILSIEEYTNFKMRPILCDLTQIFGTAIADHIYTLEQSQAGAGVALFRSMFPKDYYPFNAGGIESVKTSAKKVVGFNQWDEVWELGAINSSGQNYNSTSNVRSKNYIHILPNTLYYYKKGNGATTVQTFYYDADKNFISGGGMSWSYGVKTTPANAYYMRFYYVGTTYNHDICINFHWDGERDGEYEAYVEHTYPLDSDLELRGVPTLVDGKIKYDGDLYASDGTVTRRYGIVDLGTLNWNKSSHNNKVRFNARVQNGYTQPNGTLIYGIICGKIYITKQNPITDNAVDKAICGYVYNDGLIFYLRNDDYENSTEEDFKTAMSGIYAVYELGTPTTESADPYTSPQLVDNWGTEEFVDTRDVPIPVGHDSRYLPDLKAKVESAPNNPSTNGKYFLQYQNGEATYVPVPSEVPEAPTTDGTYVLKATVTSGTATLSWVAEE